MRAETRRRWAIAGLTGPAYLWLTLTIFLPLSAMLWFSFQKKGPFGRHEAEFTLKHYEAFFTKAYMQDLTWRSLEMGLQVTVICLVLGFPAAYVLAKRIRGRWREALFLLVVLPFWSNALVRIFSWTVVLRPGGVLDGAVQFVFPGAPAIDLADSWNAVIIGLVHSYLPYMILTCYLSLQALDDSLIEAARSLGASAATILWRIVLPLAIPGIAAGAVLIFVPVIGSFFEPKLLGGTQGVVIGTVIEEQFTVVSNWPLGGALSFILLAIVLLILAVSYPFLKDRMRTA
ncbi:MAG: ABC transporter permease [Proteobacteria bacterium]|jgi:spermidine/putrescine transport system permease protein|nr:ABC transporter permease [Pseudomonadota bacterium]